MPKTTYSSKKLRNIGGIKPNRAKKNKYLGNLNFKAMEKLKFLTISIKKVFNYLWQTFIKVPILKHFNLKSHIQIKIDI